MDKRTVNVLGSVWTIKIQTEAENPKLVDCNGYADWTSREIIIEREVPGNLDDLEKFSRKVLRHEIVHAFLCESGLCECAGEAESWAFCEAMVDWIAIQGQKIHAAWKEAGALDD